MASDTTAEAPSGWRAWIIEHDDSRAFVVLYVGLAVILSIWISLFWLVFVVAVHFGLELYSQAHRREGRGAALGAALWEVKLDIGLIFFSFVIALYMDVVLGLAGLSAAARVGARAARIPIWQRVLRGVLLSVDDAVQVAKNVVGRRRGAASPDAPEAPPEAEGPGIGDWLSLGFGALCLALVLAAPWLIPASASEVVATLLQELHPWP